MCGLRWIIEKIHFRFLTASAALNVFPLYIWIIRKDVLLISSKKSHKKAELQLEKDFVEAQSVLSVLPLYPTLPLYVTN